MGDQVMYSLERTHDSGPIQTLGSPIPTWAKCKSLVPPGVEVVRSRSRLGRSYSESSRVVRSHLKSSGVVRSRLE